MHWTLINATAQHGSFSSLVYNQVKQPHDQEVQEEWAEVKRLQQQELALKIGLPGLQIEQVYGECSAECRLHL